MKQKEQTAKVQLIANDSKTKPLSQSVRYPLNQQQCLKLLKKQDSGQSSEKNIHKLVIFN